MSNFQIGATAPMQTFLIGQPQFRDLLCDSELEQLRQRVITSYHLGPMSREEVGQYLPHRLTKAGWRNDPEFEETFVDAIFHYSEGVPRRINALASRMLLYGFLEKLHRFTAEDVEKVAADLLAEAPKPRIMSSPVAPNAFAVVANDLSTNLLSDRVDRIEQRLREQDDHMNVAISAVRDLLKWAAIDREKNALAGN